VAVLQSYAHKTGFAGLASSTSKEQQSLNRVAHMPDYEYNLHRCAPRRQANGELAGHVGGGPRVDQGVTLDGSSPPIDFLDRGLKRGGKFQPVINLQVVTQSVGPDARYKGDRKPNWLYRVSYISHSEVTQRGEKGSKGIIRLPVAAVKYEVLPCGISTTLNISTDPSLSVPIESY
jgi:hypothetical protein